MSWSSLLKDDPLYRIQTSRGSHRGDRGQCRACRPKRKPEGSLHRTRLHRSTGSSADCRGSSQLLSEVTSGGPLPNTMSFQFSLSNKTQFYQYNHKQTEQQHQITVKPFTVWSWNLYTYLYDGKLLLQCIKPSDSLATLWDCCVCCPWLPLTLYKMGCNRHRTSENLKYTSSAEND